MAAEASSPPPSLRDHGPRQHRGPVRRGLALLVGAISILPAVAWASWSEFCELEGNIAALEAGASRRAYEMDIQVVAGRRAREDEHGAYTDCTEHVGSLMDVSMRVPRRAGVPRVGDQVRFRWSAADGFGARAADAGTTTQVRFLGLHRRERGGE